MTTPELIEKINHLRAQSYLKAAISTPLERANRRDDLFQLLMAYFTLTEHLALEKAASND